MTTQPRIGMRRAGVDSTDPRVPLPPGTCLICGKRRGLTRHHVIPVSQGGMSDAKNIVPLCRKCHLGVHDPVDGSYRSALRAALTELGEGGRGG